MIKSCILECGCPHLGIMLGSALGWQNLFEFISTFMHFRCSRWCVHWCRENALSRQCFQLVKRLIPLFEHEENDQTV